MSDDPYTLSPESVFVKPPPRTLSTRIEEFYLGALRAFIVMVLAVCLIGAVVLAYRGVSSMSQDAQPYTHAPRPPLGEQFIAQIRNPSATAGQAGPAGAANAADGAGKGGEAVEVQLDRQAALVNDFLQPMTRSVTNVTALRDRQRAVAQDLAEGGPVGEVAAHARRQAEFLERVLKDKAAMDAVRQRVEKDPAYLDDFVTRLLDFYPAEVRRERAAESGFRREESLRVAQAQSQAMSQFYMALGLFAAFLVVTLVLVLLKIERNLRSRGDVIQVMSGM